MGLNSTPFISYCEIKTENTDLIADAFGLENEFDDVLGFLGEPMAQPDDELVSSLIEHMRQVR